MKSPAVFQIDLVYQVVEYFCEDVRWQLTCGLRRLGFNGFCQLHQKPLEIQRQCNQLARGDSSQMLRPDRFVYCVVIVSYVHP